jgi:hypothetical protein
LQRGLGRRGRGAEKPTQTLPSGCGTIDEMCALAVRSDIRAAVIFRCRAIAAV